MHDGDSDIPVGSRMLEAVAAGGRNLRLESECLQIVADESSAAVVRINDDAIRLTVSCKRPRQDIDDLSPDPSTKPNNDPKLFNIRNIGPADRGHYTAEDLDDWRCMPSGCPIETPADEIRADKVRGGGITALPESGRRRASMLWDVAARRAIDRHQVVLDAVEDAFVGLILGRIAIVTDQNLNRALQGTIDMVDGMMTIARESGFGQPAPVFLNQALQRFRPVFPYTN